MALSFTRKVNMSPGQRDTGDVIDAGDVNELQEALEDISLGTVPIPLAGIASALQSGGYTNGAGQITTAAITPALEEYEPLQNMRSGRINVRDYGSNAAALTSAIAAASDGMVIDMPPAEYSGTGTIVVNKAVAIMAHGAVLKGAGLQLTADHAAIYGLTVDGNAYAGGGIDLRGHGNMVSGCYVHHTSSNGMGFTAATSPVITGNLIEDAGSLSVNPTYQGNGIYGSATNAIVTNNVIRRTRGHAGVFLSDVVGGIVANNIIENTAWRGIVVYSSGRTSEQILLNGNLIRYCGGYNVGDSGVGCNGIYALLATDALGDMLICNNVVDTVAENGIEAANAMVIGNLIRNTGAYPGLPTPSIGGMWISGTSVARGNVIIPVTGKGIRYYANTVGNAEAFKEWADNVVVNPEEEGYYMVVDGSGVELKNFLIRNNTVIDTTGSPTATSGFCLATANSATIDAATVRYAGNQVVGISQSALTGATQFGNSWNYPQTANADTSGATLGNLEIEVNEIKAALRAAGLLAV